MESFIQSIKNAEATLTSSDLCVQTSRQELMQVLALELQEMRTKLVMKACEYEWHKAKTYTSPENGITEDWFDCSWFITFLLKYFDLDKNWVRHTNEYFDSYGIFTHIPLPWDLIFFSSNGQIPSHIWMCIWNNKYINKSGSTIQIDEIIHTPISPRDEKTMLYNSNPIWFKRISLWVENFKEDRWVSVV